MYWLIWDALQDLIPFVKFKKLEKHLWKSVTFSKIAGESLAKIITLPWMFFMFFKLCKCYEIAQSFLYTYETLFTLKMFYYLVQTVWWKLEIGNMNLIWAYFEQSTLLCWNMSLHSKFLRRSKLVLVVACLGGQFVINCPSAFFKIFKNHEGDLSQKLPEPNVITG